MINCWELIKAVLQPWLIPNNLLSDLWWISSCSSLLYSMVRFFCVFFSVHICNSIKTCVLQSLHSQKLLVNLSGITVHNSVGGAQHRHHHFCVCIWRMWNYSPRSESFASLAHQVLIGGSLVSVLMCITQCSLITLWCLAVATGGLLTRKCWKFHGLWPPPPVPFVNPIQIETEGEDQFLFSC